MLWYHAHEGAGHLDLVMTQQIAGRTGEDTALVAVDESTELPVLRKQHPLGTFDQLPFGKKLLRLQIPGVGKAECAECVERNPGHGCLRREKKVRDYCG